MNTLAAPLGQLFALLLVVYVMLIGLAIMTKQQALAKRLTIRGLKLIGRGLRRLLKLMCKGAEVFFRWAHSKL